MRLNSAQVQALLRYGEAHQAGGEADVAAGDAQDAGAALLERLRSGLESDDGERAALCGAVLSLVAGGAAEICLRAERMAAGGGFAHLDGEDPPLAGGRAAWASSMPSLEAAMESFDRSRRLGVRTAMGRAWRECQMAIDSPDREAAGRLFAMPQFRQALDQASFACAREAVADAFAAAGYAASEDVGPEAFAAGAQNALRASDRPNAPEAPMDGHERVIEEARLEGAAHHVRMMLHMCSGHLEALAQGGDLAEASRAWFAGLRGRVAAAALPRAALARLDAATEGFRGMLEAFEARVRDWASPLLAEDATHGLLLLEQGLGHASVGAHQLDGLSAEEAAASVSDFFAGALNSYEARRRLELVEGDAPDQDPGHDPEPDAGPDAPDDPPAGPLRSTGPRFGL